MLGLKKLRPHRQTGKSMSTRWQANIDDYVIRLAWSPDGTMLAAGAVEGPITLLDAQSGDVRHTLPGHGFGTTDLSWHPEQGWLASAGQDGEVKVWDVVNGSKLWSQPGGAAWVEHVAWNPTGDLLASAAGRELRLWDGQGNLLHQYADHPSTIASLGWRPASKEVATIGYGGITLHDLEQPEKARLFEWKGSSLVLSWSPDGKYIATGDQDSTVHFWYSDSGQHLQMWGYATKVRELSWNHTSRYLATGGSSSVVVWDCAGKGPEGSTPKMLEQHESLLTMLAYQNRGKLLASACQDGLVVLWQPNRNQNALSHINFDGLVSQIVWSPNDSYLAVGTEFGDVALLRIN
ncbi:MAG: WD40 repeat domain-containing protein [Chloroflexota bacterium]